MCHTCVTHATIVDTQSFDLYVQEQSQKEISYRAEDINTIRTLLYVQSSEVRSINGWKMEILGLGYVEHGMETQGSGFRRPTVDLFVAEGFVP